MDKKSIAKRTARPRSSALKGMVQHIKPVATWKHLAFPPSTVAELREICRQAKHGGRPAGRELTPGKGLSILFSGPHGTGKTMAAEVIANELNLDLYRIDLSAVVSKYIGETEKNLERIFTAAGNSNAILFFDEADALFGKRSEASDAHDRYANTETRYLLQRIEEYAGLAVLATNMSDNIDPAFTRRLQFIVDFPSPDANDRENLWRNVMPERTPEEDPKKSRS